MVLSAMNSLKEQKQSNSVLQNNQQQDEFQSAFGEMRVSAAVLHFGCTKRERGNNADVSRIVTDMQPFDCSSLPPDGDGPSSFFIFTIFHFSSKIC